MVTQARIIVLDPAGNMWGSERVLLDFLGSRIVGGRKVGLCCPPDTLLASAAKSTGVAVYPFFKAKLHEKGKLLRFIAAIGLYKACKQFQADIIYVNQAGASRIALFVGRLLKIPVIPHVRLLEDVRYIESLNASPKALPKVLVISKFIEDAFNDPGIKERVQVLYDAYSMTDGYDATITSSKTSKELCCAGRLVPIKGQDILIKAMAVLDKWGFKISLNIYGSGLQGSGFEAGLIKLVEDLKLTKQVAFHGFVNDIPAEMRRHQIVIFPSHVEPLGRVVFESWDSYCVPIVGGFSGGGGQPRLLMPLVEAYFMMSRIRNLWLVQ